MKTISKEVKTIYRIQLEKSDVLKAFENAQEDFKRLGKDTFEAINKEAFKSILGKEELLMKELRSYEERIIKHVWGNIEDTRTLDYIIKFLGFDGIENYGFYKENCERRSMTVYMEGDTL